MSASAQTWTFPAGQKYIDKDKIEHTIATSQNLKLTFTDDGTGGRFIGTIGDTDKVLCTDKFTFEVECDPRFEFNSSADGSATTENGVICFVEEGNVRHPFKVKSLTIANADGVGSNNITQMILESKLHKGIITWALITTA